jgi:antitoxin (DNA-binding transcriptional repressor) of toxin-antitoxin stability system
MTKIVEVSDLREHIDEYIEAVKNGDILAIFEGGKMIGTLRPQEPDEERLERLERAGIITRGTGKLPPDFLTRPLIDLGGSVVEQLLEDRRHDR